VKSQPKPQVEQKEKLQVQDKINHEDDNLRMKKKKTRKGGRARNPMLIQDTKMMSKNEDEMRDLAHIKCSKCEDMGHFASKCTTKIKKKRIKQFSKGKAMKSNTRARKRRL
jgi:hypothetical protein